MNSGKSRARGMPLAVACSDGITSSPRPLEGREGEVGERPGYETRDAWGERLEKRKPVALEGPALDRAYRTALLSIKHTQQPESGSFVAATNPAYLSPRGVYESTVPEPSWPQMSMYMPMAEYWLGLRSEARARPDWYVGVTGVGYMPPVERADWATQQPLMSTAVEPVTGTWYLLGLLVDAGQFEPRPSHVGADSQL